VLYADRTGDVRVWFIVDVDLRSLSDELLLVTLSIYCGLQYSEYLLIFLIIIIIIIIIIVIVIISKTVFMVLSSWHCESSPVHLMNVERRQAAADPRPRQSLHPPSPFIIITQPES